MAERKVLVKYYPPDFDPAFLPKTTKPKNNQQQVRLMLPMSIQCKTCGEYISKGKKFNGRKEEVVGENYLGIKIYRLYFRCIACLSEITFKTDPEHSDYTVERGASRNFEPWKQATREEELKQLKKDREEMGDTMRVLENRTEASKREMDIQDAIEEVRELNARAQGFTTEQLIEMNRGMTEELEEEKIEQMAREAFTQKKSNRGGAATVPPVVKRLPDPMDLDEEKTHPTPAAAASSLPVVKRLPDPIDFRSGSAEDDRKLRDLLNGVVVPNSPNGENASPAAAAAAASSSSAASTTAATSTSVAPPAASPTPTAATTPLAGLVLVKKRKHTDAEKEQRKKDKKQKKEKAQSAPEASAPSGLGGLIGDYADDSD